jgi:class 3 adenylate cyclase/tetratricopeptide (TPR) repeat protein
MGPEHPFSARQDSVSEASAGLACFADLTLDFVGRTLLAANGRDIPLTRGEFRLLCALVRGSGRALSRDQLLDAVAGRRAEPFDRSIDVMIGRLRRKIELIPKAPRLILTVAGFGYKFATPVTTVETATSLVSNPRVKPPEITRPPPERRHITALAVELLAGEGSTNLPADPEESQALIDVYRRYVACVVAHHGGVIKEARGREVMAFFGYPLALEHVVERAVHAALALAVPTSLASSTWEFPPKGEDEAILPNGLAVRVGVASGLVIVGSAGEVLGETPGDATRLLTLAEPGQVIIAAGTRRLSGSLFAYREIEPVTMKGVADQVQALQVLGPSALGSRSEALYGGKSAPLVGRLEERALLLSAWHQVRSGEGRVVLLTGEPGIGKSRLLVELEQWLAREKSFSLRYFCSPLQQGNALYPITVRWEQDCGFAGSDTAEQRMGKLESVLAQDELSPTDVGLLASMLGIPADERYTQPDLSPQRRRELTFAILEHRLAGIARRQPVLMLFEDVQWVDHSSLELLDRLVSRITGRRILLVISFRPDFSPSWVGHAGVSLMTLTRLDRRQSTALALQVAEGFALPQAVLEHIVARTDGVPLFIEEMTKAILETASNGSSTGLSVPSTLHALLMARLDRLGLAAKDIAQTGAAIGREFGFGLLASVTDLPEPQLHEALDRLATAGLLFVRGTPPQSNYIFKHALVQDAAYGTLLRSRRQRLHTRIAVSLEDRFPEIVRAQPTLLAQHCAEAGLSEKAVVYSLKAGEQALARSAMTEAVAQLRRGLSVLASLPDGPWRQRQELDLQSALCSALCATKGLAAADVGETLGRARVLAEQLDRVEYLPPLLDGQWGFHFGRSEHRLALSLAGQIEKIGVARNDVPIQLLGRFNLGISHFVLGEFIAARALLERCLGFGGPALRAIGETLHSDQYPITLGQLALTLAHLGYIDQARSRMREGLSEVRSHAHTLANTLNLANWMDCITHSPELLRHAEQLQAVAANEHFPLFSGLASGYRGRALTSQGQAAEGLALLSQGLAAVRATGAVVQTPLLLMWQAEAHSILGRPDEGLQYLVEAAHIVESTGERCSETELLRLQGDLLIANGDGDAAERQYRQAIAVAERQSAKLLQLRASMGLARLWCDQAKRSEACELLGPIYHWFTEGFDAPDLKEAKVLLDELA